MLKVRVSSKRQVTFPKRVCDALGIRKGDEILLDRHVENGQEVWYLKSDRKETRPWLGSLQAFARNKDNSMDAVRKSIASKRSSKPS